MKINIQKLAVLIFSLLVFLALSACSNKTEIDLPPLPTYSDESPSPSPVTTVSPSIKPSPSPIPTASPETTATPEPAEETAQAVPSPVQSPVSTPKTDMPVISIREATLPENMVMYNVSTLHGYVSVDKGNITAVNAMLTDSAGNAVQSCYYQPMQANFSLAGTVNAELQFALLQPGTYYYVLEAYAENNGVEAYEQLINHMFTVYSSYEQMASGGAAKEEIYTDKISVDSGNAATIWNFLIVYLDNPYGAAGVLANIDVESGCEPVRVQGDFSEGYSFSKEYTEQVDTGKIGRNAFIHAVAAKGYGSGYGLCQWTLDRKEGLYDLAKENETSVGDLDTQCTYLIMELEIKYPELSKFLKTTDDARAAAKEFFYVYEQGSEMGDRAGIAEAYLERFAK